MQVSTKQKFFLLLISLLSGAALVFGASQVFKNFYQPYPQTARQNFSPINSELENFYQNYSEIIALQNKDTDTDGLSDYDELYTYNTSPYLQDTDVDGLADKTELSSGSDPLCASGQNCQSLVGKNSSQEVLKNLTNSFDVSLNPEIYKEKSELQFLDQSTSESVEAQNTLRLPGANQDSEPLFDPAAVIPGDLESASTLEPSLENILSSPESLRQFLITRGMKPEDLDKLSDEELSQAVEEAMGE